MIQALLDVALIQLVKPTFHSRIKLLTFLGLSIGREFVCFSKRKYLFQDLIVIVQDPLFNKFKIGLKC